MQTFLKPIHRVKPLYHINNDVSVYISKTPMLMNSIIFQYVCLWVSGNRCAAPIYKNSPVKNANKRAKLNSPILILNVNKIPNTGAKASINKNVFVGKSFCLFLSIKVTVFIPSVKS